MAYPSIRRSPAAVRHRPPVLRRHESSAHKPDAPAKEPSFPFPGTKMAARGRARPVPPITPQPGWPSGPPSTPRSDPSWPASRVSGCRANAPLRPPSPTSRWRTDLARGRAAGGDHAQDQLAQVARIRHVQGVQTAQPQVQAHAVAFQQGRVHAVHVEPGARPMIQRVVIVCYSGRLLVVLAASVSERGQRTR